MNVGCEVANVSTSFWGGGGAFTPAQEAAAKAVLQEWSDVAQVNFFTDNSDPELAFNNYNKASDSASAHTTKTGEGNFNPDTTHEIGFNLANTSGNMLGQGQVDRTALIHEVGHGLGLKHPGGYNAGPAGSPAPTYATDKAYFEDSQQYSVMSYFGETNTGADFKGANTRTPLLHDNIRGSDYFH